MDGARSPVRRGNDEQQGRRMEVACRFLSMLFDNGASAAGPEALVSIWTLPDKRTTFHATADSAAEAGRRAADGADVYFGCGLRRAGLKPSERGGAADVVALPGLWADLDVAGPGHVAKAGKRQFQTMADAAAFLNGLQHRPSVVVSSGGGLHAYWLFTEFLTITTDAERADATALSKGWQQTLARIAKAKYEVDLDATWDLARVLRIPGTLNCKHSPPMPVEPADGQDWTRPPVRYDAADLRAENCPGSPTTGAGRAWGVEPPGEPGTLTQGQGIAENRARGATGPPLEAGLAARIEALTVNDPRFAATWRHARKDLVDPSLSAYDQSIANSLVAAGFTDADVAAAIRYFRSTYATDAKEAAKGMRKDYLARTIRTARETQIVAAAAAPDTEDEEEERFPKTAAAAQTWLRKKLRISVDRLEKIGTAPAAYDLILGGGIRVRLGTAAELLTPKRVQACIFDSTKLVMPHFSAQKWERVARAFALLMVDVHQEIDDAGHLRDILEQYVELWTPLPIQTDVPDTVAAALLGLRNGESRWMMDEADRAYFSLRKVREFMASLAREPFSARDLARSMARTGFDSVRLQARRGEEILKGRFWRSSPGWIEEEADE